MTCLATYGNGVRTGMAHTARAVRRIQLVPLRAPIACFVGAAGTTPGTAASRIGATARRRTATTTLACASFFEFPKKKNKKSINCDNRQKGLSPKRPAQKPIVRIYAATVQRYLFSGICSAGFPNPAALNISICNAQKC